jgi:hypothetical protein
MGQIAKSFELHFKYSTGQKQAPLCFCMNRMTAVLPQITDGKKCHSV